MTFRKGESFQQTATPEQLASWRASVSNACKQLAVMQRRATYPANPDSETIAIAEHYGLKYRPARILKALSYFFDTTPEELSELTGVHPAIVKMEVQSLSARTGIRITFATKRSKVVSFYRLESARDRDEIRAVMASSWGFGETLMPQSRERMSA